MGKCNLFCNPGALRFETYMVWNFPFLVLSWSHRKVTPNNLPVLVIGCPINTYIWPMKTFPQLGTAAADLDHYNNAPKEYTQEMGEGMKATERRMCLVNFSH